MPYPAGEHASPTGITARAVSAERWLADREGEHVNDPRMSERLDKVYSARSNEELAQSYDEWARHYEKDMLTLGYTIPSVIAGLTGRHVPPSGAVLDAGVGTGILGDTLKVLDYDDLVGIDLSEGMLRRAGEKGVYRELHRMALGERLDFADDSFSAVVSAGVFTEGHAPPEALDELVRAVRAGGWVVFSVRADTYERGGFKERQRSLEEGGKWRLVKMTEEFQPFPAGETSHMNRVFVYQVG